MVVRGLDRLLALLGRRETEEEREPGRPAPDEELNGRIDAARVRLRQEIAPQSEDGPAVGP